MALFIQQSPSPLLNRSWNIKALYPFKTINSKQWMNLAMVTEPMVKLNKEPKHWLPLPPVELGDSIANLCKNRINLGVKYETIDKYAYVPGHPCDFMPVQLGWRIKARANSSQVFTCSTGFFRLKPVKLYWCKTFGRRVSSPGTGIVQRSIVPKVGNRLFLWPYPMSLGTD